MPGINTTMSAAKDWFLLSRVPFFSVVLLPFILGSVIAGMAGIFYLPVFLLGFVGVVLIMLATHYNGEVYDIAEDKLSAQSGKTPFAGGSQVLVEGGIKPSIVRNAAYVCTVCALGIGIILQFFYKTGPWTLLLGLSGIITGFYYSKPPFRWVKRGFGEILIAYSFGWLPIAAGFYLQMQHFSREVLVVSLPVALTIFNVIFINEFLDYAADSKAGKTNLLVRLGTKRGVCVYILANIAAIIAFFSSFALGLSLKALWLYIVVVCISFIVIFMLIRKKHESHNTLQVICGLTIVINLLTTVSYIIGFLAR